MVLYVKTYKVYLNHYVLVGNAYFYMLLLHIKEKNTLEILIVEQAQRKL